MKKIIVGIADDQESMHEVFDSFVQEREDSIELVHFYDTGDVQDVLDDDPEALDMLFLDIVFDGGSSGTESLPRLRKAAPNLPIIFLTGNAMDDPDVDVFIKNKMATDYLEKPVSKKLFLNKIESMNNISNTIASLQSEIEGNIGVLEIIENEYNQKYQQELNIYNQMIQDLETDKQELERKRVEFELRMDELASQALPDTVKTMFKRTYPNLEFREKVIVELFGKNYDSRIFDLLSKINNNLPLGKGENMQLFPEFKIPNLYEYRISQKARLFIQKREGLPMLVYAVDYNHDKH